MKIITYSQTQAGPWFRDGSQLDSVLGTSEVANPPSPAEVTLELPPVQTEVPSW